MANLVPPAVNDTVPLSVFPFAAFGVLYTQVAEPSVALGSPLTFAFPSVPAHASLVGLTGAPPAVTTTLAVSGLPAFGPAGTTFTALAVTTAAEPPHRRVARLKTAPRRR